jgi:hypothetical protein
MQAAAEHVHMNIDYIKNLGSLYNALKASTTTALDLSDILRAELVMSVSALDYYIHELIEIGMGEIYTNKRPPTSRFLEFKVSIRDFWTNPSILANPVWLIEEIRTKHSFRSFQRPEHIADAIKLISDVRLWEAVSEIVGKPEQEIKDRLSLIVDRRNKIAHEADADPTNPGSRWPINASQVNEVINFIEKIGDTIYLSIK